MAPGQGLVLVRMGDPAYDAQLVSSVFDDHVWQYVNALDCNTGIDEVGLQQGPVLAPNPCKDVVRFQLPNKVRSAEVTLFDTMGRTVLTTRSTGTIHVSMLAPGPYAVRILSDGKTWPSALKKE
ncbi:MAG: T9SS type A sorting domain-containing protein [Flavobacteriales bacterium]|nr:T9SS type A sorting domain-containing protein [Flavobacteriales bacterium]